MLKIGDTAPEFELKDQDDRPVRLSELLKSSCLVIYFYPADFTPVCTQEACMVRDVFGELEAAGVQVVGISGQDTESHAKFAKRHGLPFRLLADPDRRVIKAYGASGLFGLPLPLGTRRVSYLVSREGTIVDRVEADLRVGKHEAFLRKAIERTRQS